MIPLFRLLAVVTPVFLAVPKCDPLAVTPVPGDFQGIWLVNGQADATFGAGIPIVAQLQAKNVSSKRVRVPIDVAPKLREAAQATWKLAFTPPLTLGPGETLEAVWILEKPIPPGSYHLGATTEEIVKPTPASFRIEKEEAPLPLRLHYESAAARLSGNTAPLIERLTVQATDPESAPSIHLQLAELLKAAGQPSLARRQYEVFAEKTYGMDPLPAWLRGKMESL